MRCRCCLSMPSSPEQLQHPRLVGVGVNRLLEQRVEFRELFEDRARDCIVVEIEGAGARKQIFDVVGR